MPSMNTLGLETETGFAWYEYEVVGLGCWVVQVRLLKIDHYVSDLWWKQETLGHGMVMDGANLSDSKY